MKTTRGNLQGERSIGKRWPNSSLGGKNQSFIEKR